MNTCVLEQSFGLCNHAVFNQAVGFLGIAEVAIVWAYFRKASHHLLRPDRLPPAVAYIICIPRLVHIVI